MSDAWAAPQRDDLPVLSTYRLGAPLGVGGTAEVFRGLSAAQDPVAIKLYAAADSVSELACTREVRCSALLADHPNVIEVLESGRTQRGRPYLITPLIAGGSVHQRLLRGEVIGIERSVRLAIMVAGALETAHRRGVFHCDLKPGNILLDDTDAPILIDFGAAAARPSARGAAPDSIGYSPLFAAPEVLAGSTATVASDIYSLGATLFALLVGRPPEPKRARDDVLQLPRDVPPLLAHIVQRMMHAEPADRFSTVLGAIDELRRAQTVFGLEATDPVVADGRLGPAPLS